MSKYDNSEYRVPARKLEDENKRLLALLTEAKNVIEPFAKSFKKLDNGALTNPKTEGMSVPYSVHDLSLNTTFKDWESTEAFLKKLEDV